MAVHVYAKGMPSHAGVRPTILKQESPASGVSVLDRVPDEIWGKIAEYGDLRDIQKMRGVCRGFNHIVVALDLEELSKRLKLSPLKILLDNSSMLGDSPIPRLARFLQFTREEWPKGPVLLLGIDPLRLEGDFSGYQSLPQRFSLKKHYHTISIEDFWGPAISCKDQRLSDFFFEQALRGCIRPSIVAQKAHYYLEKNDLGAFRKLLPYTPVFVPDEISGPSAGRVLEVFLLMASEKDLNLFEDLLKLNKLKSGNLPLVELAERNRSQAIRLLLKYTKVNKKYIRDNGLCIGNAGKWGIHTALMCAANYNHRETMDVLFRTMPSKEILIHIRDLFVNHAEMEHMHNVDLYEWRQRDRLGPQVRDEIIALFNEEIARRGPQGVELVDLDTVDLSELEDSFRLPPILDLGNDDARGERRMLLVTAAVATLAALAQAFSGYF